MKKDKLMEEILELKKNEYIEFDGEIEVLKEILKQNNTRLRKILIIITFMMVAIGITLLIKTLNSNTTLNVTPFSNELRDTLLREKEKNNQLTNELKNREKKLSQLREETTKNNKIADEQRKKIDQNNKALGLTELTGKGVQVILKDGDVKTQKELELSQLIVHDNDILQVINILRNAGAEAISVNGHRIIAQTPITCVGTVVLINNEKVGAPYVISAIGDQERLNSALSIPGGILTILEQFGVKVAKEKKDELKIPAYTGVYNFEYGKTLNSR